MTYKTILAAISGGSTSAGTGEIAARLAQRFKAHLEGLHIRLDPVQILAASAGGLGMPLPTEWVKDMEDEAAATAAKAKAQFEGTLSRNGLALSNAVPADRASGASATWRDEIGPAADLVADRARFFDLAVLGRSGRADDQPYTDTIEQVLLRAGRPVLLAPPQAPKEIGEKIAIGWNGSAEAVHAMQSALPILSTAKSVTVITVAGQREVADIVSYLAWHDISADHRNTNLPKGVGAGEQLITAARDIQADLLVMGAYGRARWRETLFGGATSDVLDTSMLPILLSH